MTTPTRVQAFKVRLLACVTQGTRRTTPGTVIEVDAGHALELVRSHRAVLVNPDDIAALAEVLARPMNRTTLDRRA